MGLTEKVNENIAFWTKERDRLRQTVSECKMCDDTGWCEPIGPCRDGSYITSRPCPNRCSEYADDADKIDKYLSGVSK